MSELHDLGTHVPLLFLNRTALTGIPDAAYPFEKGFFNKAMRTEAPSCFARRTILSAEKPHDSLLLWERLNFQNCDDCSSRLISSEEEHRECYGS